MIRRPPSAPSFRTWLAAVLASTMALMLPISPVRAVEPFDMVTTINVSFTSELVVVGNYAYVASDSEISVIDTSSNTVVRTIPQTALGRSPDGAAAIGTNVYFASRTDNKIIIIDTVAETLSYLATTGCTNPSQLRAVNATRLIANCHGSGNVQVYDVSVPSIAGTVTTGSQPRGMSTNNGLVYVPNSFSNNMTVVDAAATPPTAVRTEVVGSQPEFTGYLDGKIFVANFNSNTVSIVDSTSYNVLATQPVGNNPQGLAACGNSMLSANRWSGTTSVMSPTLNAVTDTITLGGVGAITHVVGANGGYAYFLNFDTFSVSVVDCTSLTVADTVSLTHKPSKIAFSSQYAYVTSPGAPGTISVLALPFDSNNAGEYTSGTFADFQFFTPDGRECTDISPVRVRVGTMFELPGVDASCRTMPGATVAGWTIPGPPGYTGYGSAAMAFPPGLPVRVIESQRFTLVPKEPVLQFDYDANIAAVDACVTTTMPHTSNNGRVSHVWVPRNNLAAARFATSSPCVPDGYRLIGWNTAGNGSGDTYAPGAELPTDWAENPTNYRHLYAVWTSRL